MSRINLRGELIKASKIHFKAHIAKHIVNVENMLNNSVGVGEHPDIMDSIEKELEQIANYDDLLEALNKYFADDYDGQVEKHLLND